MQVSIIGLDIAKHVFQVQAVDAEGHAVAQVRLRRAQVLDYFAKVRPCLVCQFACNRDPVFASNRDPSEGAGFGAVHGVDRRDRRLAARDPMRW
jgi:hypothetical protein